jgi:peptidoglycan/LPS O-acetylase OafA/YrhL
VQDKVSLFQRSFTVDIFKVIAAQCIVWHHLSGYGPMAEVIRASWPVLAEEFYDHARIAVQVFLVVSGFLAAQSVGTRPVTHPLASIFKRYLRLVPFYLLVIALISLAVAWARPAIQGDWLPDAPTLGQLGAHALLITAFLDYPALSSGVWYVAIDFQLYVLMALLAFVLRPTRALSLGVATVCAVSMLWFNRILSLDNWAIYFFGAYGLGVLAAWAKRSRWDAALWLEFRTRLTLALATAVWLVIRPKGSPHWTPAKRVVHRLANSAYAQFLTHFGLIVMFSSMWNTSQFSSAGTALALCAFIWLCSIGLGLFMHEKAEVPIHHWLSHQSKLIFLRFTN